MACALTTGRELPCKTGFGGIKFVYFADFGTLGTVTFDGDNTISALIAVRQIIRKTSVCVPLFLFAMKETTF